MCLSGLLFSLFVLLVIFIKGSENEFVAVIVKEVAGPFTSSWSKSKFGAATANVSPHHPSIILVPDDLHVKGAWTLLPLIPRLLDLHPNVTWLAFLKESTRTDWARLLELTSRFDPTKEWFIGHELYDQEPTIVHHFAFHHDPSVFKYPHMEAGILLSGPVLKRIGMKMARDQLLSDFSIDVQHELALYLSDGVNLTHSDALCLEPGPQCATWIQPFEPCGTMVALSDVYFAVKTYSKFHKDRLPVIQKTWGNKVQEQLTFFSDLEDESIPTISLGVPNTESGHCSKTMAIIDHLAKEKSRSSWYVIADDDTILGVRELRELLSCYDPSHPFLIGQKYGFASGQHHGYDYITGGGGMVLSRAALVLVAGNPNGRCPQADTPDDMWLGSFAETLGVSIVHFSGFHQARPDDYPLRLLQSQHVVSFHKHWMIDPLQVYSNWFHKDTQEMWIVESGGPTLSHLLGSKATHGLIRQQRQLADEL